MNKRLFILILSFCFTFGLTAQQTHFPIYNPAITYSPYSADSNEQLGSQWRASIDEVKQQVHADEKDFAAFLNFYQGYIDSASIEFGKKIEAGKINFSNIGSYMNSQKQSLLALYTNFSKIKNNLQFPKLLPSYTPPSCNGVCTNMDFSDGNLTGWYGYYAENQSTTHYIISKVNGGLLGAVQRGAYDPNTRTYMVHLTSSGNNDWFMQNYHNTPVPQASPWGSGNSVMIGDSVNISTPDSGQMAILTQEFQVTNATNSVTYAYSIFIENPAPVHPYYQQPFFSVTMYDQNGDTIKNCGEYFVSAGPGLPGFKGEYYPPRRDSIYWRNWTEVNVPLTNYVGQCVTIRFTVSDCSLGGHCGYAYVDASCSHFAITASSPSGVICGKHGYITLIGPPGEKAYVWSGPSGGIITNDTLQDINGDSLGKYKLIITPLTGALCKDTLYYTVKGRDTISSSAAVTATINCYGAAGTALVKEANGFGAFTYAWTPTGGSNATGTGLTAGTYTVTVEDTNACVASAIVVLTQPTQVIASTSFTQATCGNSNGTATVATVGGYTPYTYSWNPSAETTAKATGLKAGSYTVTVTDKNHCTTTASVTVTQPSAVTAAIAATTPVNCFGGNNGTASVTGGGGNSPYSYTWTPKGGTTFHATGLSAGTYTVTVKDSNGCTATTTATITQPTLLTATISSINNIPCNGETGSATAAAAGGTSPYTYLWAPSGGTNATGTGLSAGGYIIGVADYNGCTATTTVIMTQPAILSVTGSSTHASCNLPNGTATATVSGGTTPYAYLWTPSGETIATATGLSIGTYTVNVTDKNHCTTSVTITVTQPTLVTASITSVTNVSCYLGGNGTATVAGVGGTGPYTYLWTPSNNTDAHITGLFALGYLVIVTDANGCTATASTTLTQPPQLTVLISEPRVICKDSTGIILADVSGGVEQYKYAWSSGITSTTSSATVTPVATRDYSVTVTDANGCTATTNIILQYGPSITLAMSGQTSICRGDSTTLCVLSSGGTGGNVYLWNPITSTNSCITVSPALSELYTVLVTDNCGATATTGATVYATPTPVINFGADFPQGCAPLCVQFLNNTTLSQGKVRQYVWNFGNGDTMQTRNPIYCYTSSGNYNIRLTAISDSGCSATLDILNFVKVYTPPKASFIYSPQQASILTPTIQFADESMDAYGPIAYRWWNFGDGTDSSSNLQNPSHTYSDTGTYCAKLIVMDSHGCMDTVTNCLIIEPQYNLYIPSAFTPNGDGINQTFKPVGQYIKGFEMYIFDRWGMELYHTIDINEGWNGGVHGAGIVCQEDTYIYKITLTDSEGIGHSYIGNVNLLK